MLEVITTETRKAAARATRDATALQTYRRFLVPISERVLADPAMQMNRTAILRFIYGSLATVTGGPGCS